MIWGKRIAIGLAVVIIGGFGVCSLVALAERMHFRSDVATVQQLKAKLKAEGFKMEPQQFYAVAPPSNDPGLAPVRKALALLQMEARSQWQPKGSETKLDPENPKDEALIAHNLALMKPGIIAFCRAASNPKAVLPFPWSDGDRALIPYLRTYRLVANLATQLAVQEARSHHDADAIQDFTYAEALAVALAKVPNITTELVAMAIRKVIFNQMLNSFAYENSDLNYLKGCKQVLVHMDTEDFVYAFQGEIIDRLTFVKQLESGPISPEDGTPVGRNSASYKFGSEVELDTLLTADAVYSIVKAHPNDLDTQSVSLLFTKLPADQIPPLPKSIDSQQAKEGYFLFPLFPSAEFLLEQSEEIGSRRLLIQLIDLHTVHIQTGEWPTKVSKNHDDHYIVSSGFNLILTSHKNGPSLAFTDQPMELPDATTDGVSVNQTPQLVKVSYVTFEVSDTQNGHAGLKF